MSSSLVGTIVQETLLWDDGTQKTKSMRSKEKAHDYRYFPDPDLPTIVVSEEWLARIKNELPRLPDERIADYTDTLSLPTYDAQLLAEERSTADYFERVLQDLCEMDQELETSKAAKAASNVVMTDVLRVLKEKNIDANVFDISPDRLAGLIYLKMTDKISSSGAQELFDRMQERSEAADVLAEEYNLLQVSDKGALEPVIEEVLQNNPAQLKAYLNGKEGLIGYFIGQVMRSFPGSPDPKIVRTMLLNRIHSISQE